jgi:hypothetical protein
MTQFKPSGLGDYVPSTVVSFVAAKKDIRDVVDATKDRTFYGQIVVADTAGLTAVSDRCVLPSQVRCCISADDVDRILAGLLTLKYWSKPT